MLFSWWYPTLWSFYIWKVVLLPPLLLLFSSHPPHLFHSCPLAVCSTFHSSRMSSDEESLQSSIITSLESTCCFMTMQINRWGSETLFSVYKLFSIPFSAFSVLYFVPSYNPFLASKQGRLLGVYIVSCILHCFIRVFLKVTIIFERVID